jgi:hypothetical protein
MYKQCSTILGFKTIPVLFYAKSNIIILMEFKNKAKIKWWHLFLFFSTRRLQLEPRQEHDHGAFLQRRSRGSSRRPNQEGHVFEGRKFGLFAQHTHSFLDDCNCSPFTHLKFDLSSWKEVWNN